MPLNRRQLQSYRDVINVYVPLDLTVNVDKSVQDLLYPAQPNYSGVKCALNQTDEFDEPQYEGRTKVVNLFVLDKLFVLPEQDIEDGYCFTLRTANHPDIGAWWIVQGNPKDRPNKGRRRANYKKLLAKRVPKPAGIA